LAVDLELFNMLELKVGSGASEALIREGLGQTAGYMDRCGADEGHLVIFDRNPSSAWEEKIWRRAEVHSITSKISYGVLVSANETEVGTADFHGYATDFHGL
jgi:hypothetical protein